MERQGLELSTLDGLEALEQLSARDWDTLVEALPHPSPYLLHGWLVARLRERTGAAEPRVHVARRDGRLAAALPLEVSRVLGLRLAQLAAGPHAVWGDVLLAPGEPESTAKELVDRASSSEHDFLRVHGLAADSRLARLGGLQLVPRSNASVVGLDPGWDAVYRAKVSKRHRQDHRQKRRALGASGRLETRIARTPEELAAVLPDTFRLHELRWAGRDERYAYANAPSRRFMDEAVRLLGERGQYRIVTLDLDGVPIAFLSYFVVGAAAVGHRTAFDPVHGRCSPGALVFVDGLADAASAGLDRFEFGDGNESFKRVLEDRHESVYDGFGVVTDLRGRLAMAAALEATRLRVRLRRWEPLRRAYARVRVAPARASRDAREGRSSGRTARAGEATRRRIWLPRG